MTNKIKNDIFLQALRCNNNNARPPIWLLRQAGRYQKEYLLLREKCRNFIGFCKDPDLTTQAAMIPIKNYDLDAAILFSDILTVPDAMGLGLSFKQDVGPIIKNNISDMKDVNNIDTDSTIEKLNYVATAVKSLKHELAYKIPLIGFCGSPWTLACYMVAGQGSRDFIPVKKLLWQHPDILTALLSKITTVSMSYLEMQINSGADAVMIFDSWGGILDKNCFKNYSLNYIEAIIKYLRAKNYDIPVIVFTKGSSMWLDVIANSGCNAVSIDCNISIVDARSILPKNIAIQGNLDPTALFASDEVISSNVLSILRDSKSDPGFIFNLSHGINKFTDEKKVKYLVNMIKSF